MHKGLLVILDGLGDHPNPALNGHTPLQAAHTPVMDGLVAAGSCGLIDPLIAGFPVDTHTGSAALMGVARKDLLALARGPIEAAGVGVDMRPGDILLRANFATLQDDGRTIIDRRAGRITKGTAELAQVLQDVNLGEGISASVFPATHHRAVVRLRGENLSLISGDRFSPPHIIARSFVYGAKTCLLISVIPTRAACTRAHVSWPVMRLTLRIKRPAELPRH